MQKLNEKDSKKLIALCSVAYFVSYLTRVNYAAVIAAIISAGDVTKTVAGAVTTVGFITYGVGQLISGWLGDKINPKNLMFAGFITTGLMNLMIPFSKAGIMMCLVWGVNGFAQSLMWPPMVKIMKIALTADGYNKGCVSVSWGSTIATIMIYLVSPFIISVSNWRGVFFVNGSVAVMMSAVWIYLLTKIEKQTGLYYPLMKGRQERQKHSFAMDGVLLVFVMLAIFLQGSLRDGITTWIPTYIYEVFKLNSEKSILTGVIVPVFSLASIQLTSIMFNKMGKKPFKCTALLFITAVVSAGSLAVFSSISIIVTVILSALIVACMHGINLILVCMLPAIYADEKNMSTLSGTLNFTTYVGSAASTYGFAVLSDSAGWNGTVIMWTAIAALGAVMCVLSAVKAKEKNQ
ncbi:MAG: MFS transporter [Clostridia bacterium]|nr:MFS transporter [Clostridia bacterium]